MVVKFSIFQVRQIFLSNLQSEITEFLDVIDVVHPLKLDNIKVLNLAMAGNLHIHNKLLLLVKQGKGIAFFKTLFCKIRH